MGGRDEGERFAAFCAGMARAEGVILAMARRAGVEGDELVARTWVRGWERLGDVAAVLADGAPGGGAPNLKAYLVRMAANLLTDLRRREAAGERRLAGRAKERNLPALVSLEWAMGRRGDNEAAPEALYAAAGALGSAPEAQLERRWREEAVERAIGELPLDERVALEDYLEGRRAGETAAALGLRRSAAYERLASARVALAAALLEEGIAVPAAGETRRMHRRVA